MIPNEIKKLEHAIDTNNLQLIYEILMTILTSENATTYIREYHKLFFKIIPELEKTYGFEQYNKWHIYDVFEHTMKVIENTEPNPYLRLASLFHDIGKPQAFFKDENGVGHFYGHQKISLDIFKQFANKYNLDKETRKIVGSLIYHHDGKLSIKKPNALELINELGIETIPLLFALKKADNLAQNPELAIPCLEEVNATEKIYQDFINEEQLKLTKGIKNDC